MIAVDSALLRRDALGKMGSDDWVEVGPCSARKCFSTGQWKAEDVPPTCTIRVYPQVLFN